jgi:nitroreductase
MTRRQILAAGAAAGLGATAVVVQRKAAMQAYGSSVAAMRAELAAQPDVPEFIRFASLAPSGHNAQPWAYRVAAGRIDILPDVTRRTPVVDPDDHHLFVSLGCAAENLALALRARGRSAEPSFDATCGGLISMKFGAGSTEASPLFDAIPRRQSTRADYDSRPVSAADLRLLAVAAAVPGVDLALISDPSQIDQVRDLVVAGNSTQMADAAFVGELKHWLRFSPSEAIASGGSPSLPAWLGPHVFDWVFRVACENDKYACQLRSSAGVAVFVSQRDDRDHWVRAGRACQRFALQATALGISHAFINQPVEVAGLRPELAALVGMPGRRPDIVMRFGYGPLLPFSARRPLRAVLT